MRKRTWRSTTFWITLWAIAIITYLVVLTPSASFITSVIPICGAIILAYVGGNKAVDFKHGPEQEPNSEGQ
jgi:hypothetical protein